MNIWERLLTWLRRPAAASTTTTASTPTTTRAGSPLGADSRQTARAPLARFLAGGRITLDSADQFPSSLFVLVPPPDYESNWQTFNLDANALTLVSPAKLLEMLADLSPEVSRGLWDFLRLCNPGWEAVATKPGRETQNNQAQTALDAFIATLNDLHGSIDIVFGRLFIGAYLRGAFMAELVLDEAGRMPIDLATPDPATARFRRRSDPVRGPVWQLGQWQGAEFVELSRETIRYIPIDPFPATPYGRPLAAPALFTSLFLLSLLHDLKRVVQQQGYPRIDLSIDTERLLAAMQTTGDDTSNFQALTQDIVSMVERAYSQLEPDDAYIHTDVVTVNRPVGAVDSSALGSIDALITALERMATRALKSMPLLMGINDTTTETNANRQWELYAAGIKSLQHYAETMLSRLFGLALEAQGIQADVTFRFAELRAAEMFRDAQTEQLQIDNEIKKYQQGWTSQDEGSETITGHPADQAEPRQASSGAQFQPAVDTQLGQGNSLELLMEVRLARQEVAKALEQRSNGYH